jgi:hypothetical protein
MAKASQEINNPPRPARKLTETEKLAAEERRIEINYLRHLKRKYPEDDRRISDETIHTRI